MNKITNSEKEKRYKERKILRTVIIIFALITIVLSVLSITIRLSFIFPLITYLITVILTYVRNRLDYHSINENIKKQQEIDKKVKKSK